MTAAFLALPIELNALDRATRRDGEAEARALEEVGILAVRCKRCGRIAVITGERVGGSRPCHRTTGQRVGHTRARRALGLRETGPRWVLAGVVAAVALVEGAGVGVRRAGRPGPHDGIGRAGGAGAGAGLGDVAPPGDRCATHRALIAGRVCTGDRADGTVAPVRGADVAVVRAGRPRRLDGVSRAAGAAPRAGLCEVALVDRCATHRARVARRVRAERVAGAAVARVGGADVAIVRAGCPRRLDGGRAGGARPRAGVVEVALVERRVARRARVPRRVLAGHVGTIALIQGAGVGVGRAGSAGRLLGVRRTGGGNPVAGLRQLALARRRAADPA